MSTNIEKRWWEDKNNVRTKVAGVFEGGGAKGIAYVGALDAVLSSYCWFDAVAGASAGAITALAVASGLNPQEINDLTIEALREVASRDGNSRRSRLRTGEGYFAQEPLRKVLENMVETQMRQFEPAYKEKSVTFDDLFRATGIELNVVCADLSQNRLVVFSHHDTPQCQVVDAVIASSAIPFAFRNLELKVSEQNGAYWHDTIVDGGVSSNFPIFVFRDRAFRHYAKRPDTEARPRILGFVLKETRDDALPAPTYKTSRFDRPDDKSYRGWETRNVHYEIPRSFFGHIFVGLFAVLGNIGKFIDFVAGRSARLRWRPASKSWIRHFVELVNGVLGFFQAPIPTMIVILVTLLGLLSFENWLIDLIMKQPSHSSLVSDPKDFSDVIFWGVFVRYIFLPLLALGFPLFWAMFGIFIIANMYLLTPFRQLAYGLARTYVAGTGAVPWVECIEGVIALPIPLGVTTLSFDLDDALRKKTIDSARDATKTKLKHLLSKWSDNTTS